MSFLQQDALEITVVNFDAAQPMLRLGLRLV